MKRILIFPFFAVILALAGCLKGNEMNIDPKNTTSSFLQMEYVQAGGTTVNSGLQYFSGGSLTYPGTDVADTATYTVYYAGPSELSKDLPVTIGIDANAMNDNFSVDSITYSAMPDSLYHLITTTGTIKAGTRTATFQVIFYPSKIDITQSYILPIGVSNTQGVGISSNFGHIYFHAIGNPLAGSWSWDFTRYNNSDGSGTPTSQSFTGSTTTFVPTNPTSIKVHTGYYVQPDYLITFKNIGGVLSNFTAVIAPDEIAAAFTNNGITVTDGPHITVSADNKTITIQYVVYNGSANRYLIDKYYK
jgi:hypothetical protein